jgi:pimeloyl-ACP methyl ester carboxylesterase
MKTPLSPALMQWTLRRLANETVVSLLLLLTLLTLLSSCRKDDDEAPDPLPAATRRVDVGGYGLQTRLEGTANPTVVFLSGLGEPLATWEKVQPGVAAFARTLAYDRGGIGASDPVTGSRTSLDVARELQGLLTRAQLSPPYVLVAHSQAGFHARVFAREYPGKVAGLVLVDVMHPEEIEAMKAAFAAGGVTAEQALRQVADAEGMKGAVREEFLATVQNADQLGSTPLPRVPLAVLSAALPDENETAEARQARIALNERLAAQVPGGRHILATASKHHVQWDQPQLVTETIRQVVASIR